MKLARIATWTALIALLAWPGVATAQPGTAKGSEPTQAPSPIQAINQEYERELIKLERHRLESLGKLAQGQAKDQAIATYDALFRLAIDRNLYAEATPYAAKVIRSEGPTSGVTWLAHLVQIVGEAERGAYEESLKSLASALRIKGADQARAAQAAGLTVATQASIVDAYYQRLIQADQIDAARKAMKLVFDGAQAPAIRDLAARRIKQLDLVGKPAPALVGTDLDGKPFTLADARGEVVLVVFWATWCLPNAQQLPWLDYISKTYHSRGFRVVGINLDSAQEGHDPKAMLPMIHRHLLDYNVTWPNLLNGTGDRDYAAAFGVTELPASVLIGRDGKVSHLDLGGRKLERAVADAVARKP